MESRKIKLIVLLLTALLSSATVFSENENGIPIFLYYNNETTVDGIRRPHRVPRNSRLSLEISFCSDTKQLIFSDSQKQTYLCVVTDNDNNEINEFNLNFENQECIVMYLDTQYSGICNLYVSHDGYTFSGSFNIE